MMGGTTIPERHYWIGLNASTSGLRSCTELSRQTFVKLGLARVVYFEHLVVLLGL
jgi:hypothetical protein